MQMLTWLTRPCWRWEMLWLEREVVMTYYDRISETSRLLHNVPAAKSRHNTNAVIIMTNWAILQIAMPGHCDTVTLGQHDNVTSPRTASQEYRWRFLKLTSWLKTLPFDVWKIFFFLWKLLTQILCFQDH